MKKALIALTILAGALSGAQAGIILSDDFVYNNGPIAQTSATAINPSSTWIANTGGGAGKEIDVTNNTLIVTTFRSEDMFHTLAGYPYATNGPTTALYSRFLMKCTYLPNSTGTYFAHFGGTNAFQNGPPNISGFRARLFTSMTNLVNGTGANPALGQFNLGISSSGYYRDANTGPYGASLGSTNFVWPTPLVTNTTYTIVTRYVLGTGVATLWVNPTAETDPSVTDPSLLPDESPWPTGWPTNGIMPISGYDFRQASGEGTLLINGLRIGTRFADVAGNNQAPSISSIADQSVPRDGATAALPFTVSDPETPANELVVTATSSNTGLVPNAPANITLTSDAGGTNRTIKITPATGQQGSATITVNVSDSVNTSFTTFKITVGAPTVAAIANQITTMSTPTPIIPFAVGDAEGDVVTLTAASSNPALVPVANVGLGVAGPGSSNVVVTPTPGLTGVSTITISANDTHNITTTIFKITVTPAPLGLVYDENFAYTSFDLDTALYNATGGSGYPWQHVSGASYQIMVTNIGTSSFALLGHTNTECLGSPFIGSAIYDGSLGYVFYTSFTVNFALKPSSLGEYFFHLSASGTDSSAFHDKVFANSAGAAPGKFRLGIANFSGSMVAQNPRDLDTNVTYAVITRFNAATGDSTLWINPVATTSSGVTASDNSGSSTIGGVGFREPGGAIGDIAVGPMKVGTAFSDVWTVPARPTLNITVSGSTVNLNWTDPSGLYVLQQATDVAGPYT
ncbi:MAG: hypothetical protein WCL11_25880, partial [Verrucomicrobiota bacterium]